MARPPPTNRYIIEYRLSVNTKYRNRIRIKQE